MSSATSNGKSPKAGGSSTEAQASNPYTSLRSTAPKGSDQWMEDIWTEAICQGIEEGAQMAKDRASMSTASGWAKARDEFLKSAYPTKYKKMKADGSLKAHLEQVGQEAQEMYDTMEVQAMTSPDLPKDYAARVQHLEGLPEQLREMVNHEFIHAKL